MIWRLIAWIVTRECVFNWLLRRGERNPYSHITSRDGKHEYMRRYWIFNPYGKGEDGRTLPARWAWLPSIRLHHILRKDDDEHLHDHPWTARTIILRDFYMEQLDDAGKEIRWREQGYTGPVSFGQFHRILYVPEQGTWTLFITWKYQGTWGFRVDGVKVPYREYFEGRDNGKY